MISKKQKFIILSCEWANTYQKSRYDEVVKEFEHRLNEVIAEAIFEDRHAIDSADFKDCVQAVNDIKGMNEELHKIYMAEVLRNQHKK